MSRGAHVKQPGFVRILKLRLWIVGLIRPRELQITLFWAGCTGLLAGLGCAGFRELIELLQWLFTGHTGGLVRTAQSLLWWQRLCIPTLGALGAGLLLHFSVRLARGKSSTDFMEAIVLGDGVMHPRPILVRCTSSLLSIASGGSIGREGPMVQLSSMLASWLGRLIHMPTPRLRLLVACGVAGGIASAYRAPIAGSLFVAEIVLGSIAMESFGPLVFAAVIATLASRMFTETTPLYSTGGVAMHSNWELIPYLVLGLLAGALGPLFLRLLRVSEKFFSSMPVPVYARLMCGGLVVGAISTFHSEVWGNGYSVVVDMLHRDWSPSALALTLVCKLAATAATVGSGAVGGVFTPTLFVGAVLGKLFEGLYHVLWPHMSLDPRACALVGMGSFLAATTHAPLMAIIMLFEMTLDYDIVLPLMLSCVTAYYTAYGLDHKSIYTESIERKKRRAERSAHPVISVADLLKAQPPAVLETTKLETVAKEFALTKHNFLYVTDDQGRLRGLIALGDIRDYLDEPLLFSLVKAFDVMTEVIPVITPEMGIVEAAQQFTQHKGERLPVIDSAANRQLIGSISKTDLLLSLAEVRQEVTDAA